MDKVNFVNDLKSFVASHSPQALKNKTAQNGGKLSFKLNDQVVELTLNEEFFFNAHELESHTRKWSSKAV